MLKSRTTLSSPLRQSCFSPAAPKSRSAASRSDVPKEAAVGFINQVWKVSRSSGVEPGMMYVFLSDGTLVITSPHGKPAFGTWKFENRGLTMVEESIPYKVEILKLSPAEFTIRMHSPGGPLEITFVPADRR